MKRPHVYQNNMRGVLTDDGRFAPGVTSILKRGLPTPEALARWKYTHPQAAEITARAATRGTALHTAIEAWLRGELADATHLTEGDIHGVEEFATVFGVHDVIGVEEEILVDDGDLLYSGTADHLFVPTTDLHCVTG